MKPKSKPQVITALADILIKVPAAQRTSVRDSVECLLHELGLDIDEHQYLFSLRFRNHIDGLRSTPAANKRRYHFEMATGPANEFSQAEPWAEGHTSLAELILFLGRTEAMVRRYLLDDKKRDGYGIVYLNHRRTRQGLLRMYDLGPEKEGSGLTLYEAVALEPKIFARRGSY